MKLVVQRVSQASCLVNQHIVGAIDAGFVVFVGFTHSDTIDEVRYLAKKVAKLRVFEDENGKLNQSLQDCGYAVLSISQFTLYGDAKKGNRPSFTEAMNPIQAEELYYAFNKELEDVHHIPVATGQFGEHMVIEAINDGPVTILLEK
ncbi:D-aminoacyl-tRNA deacylase [Candidatus Xianfuyuplasma coldseepsis]|uniref:D-aminoacyl-tRNA deacylase n=1 Tax=Candidatus Xianfuyuplasma coldseepsis TaxID=2782163 RepID=A0A7L7KSU9_9MOLU|nr:D-aminoacyl-tRNA deacylase [Xianfuyuplasma coldseepsis]QMS85891.1 D-tyrosyl-tRNA(Tyr) deacylase [Xianfuyuplasma coldseepsis]